MEKAAQAELDAKIEAAKNSADPSKVLEAEVAEAVRKDLVAFNKKVIVNGIEIGEIDVETDISIIEVTIENTGKNKQIKKLVNDKIMNSADKLVVLYAPNYSPNATRDIEKTGGYVVRSKQELLELLEKSKKESK